MLGRCMMKGMAGRLQCNISTEYLLTYVIATHIQLDDSLADVALLPFVGLCNL